MNRASNIQPSLREEKADRWTQQRRGSQEIWKGNFIIYTHSVLFPGVLPDPTGGLRQALHHCCLLLQRNCFHHLLSLARILNILTEANRELPSGLHTPPGVFSKLAVCHQRGNTWAGEWNFEAAAWFYEMFFWQDKWTGCAKLTVPAQLNTNIPHLTLDVCHGQIRPRLC